MTLPDAVRAPPSGVAAEGGSPAGLAMDREARDARFRSRVREALDDPGIPAPPDRAMAEVQALIDGKRRART